MVWKHVLTPLLMTVLTVVVADAQTNGLQTVDQLVELALRRNPEYLAVKQRVAEAQGIIRQAGVRPAAAFELEGGSGRPLGSAGEEEFAVGYVRQIETAGKREKRGSIASKLVGLAESEIQDRARLLTAEVKRRFADAAAEQEKARMFREVLTTQTEYHRLTRARVEQGDAAALEAELLAVDLSRTEAEQITSNGRWLGALLDLKAKIGLGPTESLAIGGEFSLPSVEAAVSELQSRALEERPDLRAARLLEEQAEGEIKLAEAERRPDLTLSARYALRNSRFEDPLGSNSPGAPLALRDRDNVITFGLSIPLFSPQRNQGNIEAASARLAAARLRTEHMRLVIPMEVDAAFSRWTASRRALDLLRSGVVERSERNLQTMRQAYNLGQLRMLDVLNQQRKLLESRLALIDAGAESMRALAELERAVGRRLP